MTRTSQKRCAFCGEIGKLSKEHIFSQWIQKSAAKPKTHTNHIISRPSAATVRHEWQRGRVNRPGDPLEQTLKVVCEHCNNGWMSRLDQRIDDTLCAPDRPLKIADYRDLATWSVMKTMIWEFADVGTMVAIDAQRRFLFEHQRPPPGWGVWFGPYSGLEFHHQFFHRALLLGSVAQAKPQYLQMTVFGLSGTIIHTAGGDERLFGATFPHAPAYGQAIGLHTLWPNIDIQPGRPAISDVDVRQIMDRFGAPSFGPRPPIPQGA